MLIRQFRSSFYLQYLLLVVLAAALWSGSIITACDTAQAGPESPASQLIFKLLPHYSLLLSALGFVLLVLEALYLNVILIRHEITPKNSLVAALVYILLMSQGATSLSLHPILCSMVFAIPALDRILRTYGTADPTKDVFSAAILLSMASLFYFPMFFLTIVLILSLFVFGTFSIRILFVGFTGVVAVYLYLFLYYFVMDDLQSQWCLYVLWFSDLPAIHIDIQPLDIALWAIQDILFLMAFFYVLSKMNEWNISVRKMMLLSLYLLLITFASMLYLLDDIRYAGMITALPFAIFISAFLSTRKKLPWWLELYFFIWLVFTLLSNLFFSSC